MLSKLSRARIIFSIAPRNVRCRSAKSYESVVWCHVRCHNVWRALLLMVGSTSNASEAAQPSRTCNTVWFLLVGSGELGDLSAAQSCPQCILAAAVKLVGSVDRAAGASLLQASYTTRESVMQSSWVASHWIVWLGCKHEAVCYVPSAINCLECQIVFVHRNAMKL